MQSYRVVESNQGRRGLYWKAKDSGIIFIHCEKRSICDARLTICLGTFLLFGDLTL